MKGRAPLGLEFSESTSPGEVLLTAIHISGTAHRVYISNGLVLFNRSGYISGSSVFHFQLFNKRLWNKAIPEVRF